MQWRQAVQEHFKLFSNQVMLAPLVGRSLSSSPSSSELPYRLLCRQYGAKVTFTEMCVAEYYLSSDHRYHKGYTLSFFRPHMF